MERVPTAAGTVVIVTRKAELPNTPEDGVIHVLDDRRNERMPNVRIAFSYRQRTRAEMDAVLSVLAAREAADPSPWRRTIESMRREWELHNLAYRLHLLRGSARHVDLDNKDERMGLLPLLWRKAAARWKAKRGKGNTLAVGRRGERMACRYLQRHGYRLLYRNYAAGRHEIDLVMQERRTDTVVFVEVKTRSRTDYGRPAEAVTAAKRRYLRLAAESFLLANGLSDRPARFDVVEVLLPRQVFHITDAFSC